MATCTTLETRPPPTDTVALNEPPTAANEPATLQRSKPLPDTENTVQTAPPAPGPLKVTMFVAATGEKPLPRSVKDPAVLLMPAFEN